MIKELKTNKILSNGFYVLNVLTNSWQKLNSKGPCGRDNHKLTTINYNI